MNDQDNLLADEEAVEQGKRGGKFIPQNPWEILEKRKEQGKFNGDIETIVPKTIVNLTSGKHYFEVEDSTKRSIICTSCPVKHGGVLEAHILSRYHIENGILYLDDKAINKTP